MQFLNIAGYKFINLIELEELRQLFLKQCEGLLLKGTILLTPEGINMSLAGEEGAVKKFQSFLAGDERFADISFHHTYSADMPFRVLKVKLRSEIITMRQCGVSPIKGDERAPDISPRELKRWLDEKRDFTLLDTRNDFEYKFGSFTDAVNLHIGQFTQLPDAIHDLDKTKPVVMFCTGGIRCEKAAIYMLKQGFSEVYQLDGGILGYFAQVGGAYYEGECFVFDARVALNPSLQYTGMSQCESCQGPIAVNDVDCQVCLAS